MTKVDTQAPVQTHSVLRGNKKHTWDVATLWKHAAKLEPFQCEIDTLSLLDEDCWFGDRYEPTVRKVLEHFEKIQAADLAYPIILSEDDIVMDGLHRICKALLDGKKTILAVKFDTNPAPDLIEDTV